MNTLPLPYQDQYECRNETLEVYASDRRGLVEYRFNNLGYRNDIDYDTSESNAGVYIGSSITAGIGVEWSKSFAKRSAEKLGVKCYHFGQGCQPVDNQELLRLLDAVIKSGFQPRFVVMQFIDLDRRYNAQDGQTTCCDDQLQNLTLFYQTWQRVQRLLDNLPWCFLCCDAKDHAVDITLRRDSHCVSWNFPFLDLAGVGKHPGNKWHDIIAMGIVDKLNKVL